MACKQPNHFSIMPNPSSNSLTLLLTAPQAELVVDLARQRPDWNIVSLGEAPPASLPPGKVWGFVDWLCPSISGLELCRRLRDAPATRQARLTMVLDDAALETRRRAIQAGADDYLVGPLSAAQLLERVASEGDAPPRRKNQLVNGPLSLDPQAHQVRVDGKVVALRPNEFRLLAHFMENPDQVFSRATLIDRLGKDEVGIDERTVDVWVGRLRRALAAYGAPDPLRTVRSLGYVMDSLEA